jgi:thiol-disulfide isomerase/thioredoxin
MKTVRSWLKRVPALAGVLACTAALHAADVTPIKAGTEAPSFSLPTLTGTREALSVWCGKTLSKPFVNSVPQTVILSFWATYCLPCQKEIPELMKFAEKHAGDKVKVFLVNIDPEGAAKAGPFVKDKGYTLPVLVDPYRKTAERYGVKELPSLVVIGADGVVRCSWSGYKAGTDLGAQLEKIMESINAGKPVVLDAEQVAGETVAVPASVPQEPAAAAAPETKTFSARQKWHAVAQIETGKTPDEVAQELGVSKVEVEQWYEELKKAALEMWGKK